MATQQQALKAYTALTSMGRKVTGETAFKLFKLKQELKTIVEFQVEQEQEMVARNHGTISETGQINFTDEDDRKKFVAEHKELGEMECDVKGITLKIESIPGITMDEIEALDGIITFE